MICVNITEVSIDQSVFICLNIICVVGYYKIVGVCCHYYDEQINTLIIQERYISYECNVYKRSFQDTSERLRNFIQPSHKTKIIMKGIHSGNLNMPS